MMALFILALCFGFSSIYWNSVEPISRFLVARPENIFVDREYWRLITTIFVHGDLKHLLSNSIMLMVMSYYVYSHYGTKVYPLLSIFMGAIVNIFVLMTFEREISIVGISGVVYFLWGFWLYLFLRIQTQIRFTRRLMKVLIVGSFLLIPEAFEANVSHLAHFLGFVLGVLNALFYYSFNRDRIDSFERWEFVEDDEGDFVFDSELDYEVK